ncbi:uncharacterized protein [Haliotis cracherodii]|uniref:uncharacterized protein n=1 Tax=Haliotis cracherodii TaxID=6455 RepID=UPI0039EA62CD
MAAGNIPEDVKKNVRAVLLSKIGGVLVSDFRKDYRNLTNKKLFIENYGFDNYKDFVEAIPEYARLEYSDKDMAYRLFGVGDPNTYMSLSAKKAQGNIQGSLQKGHSSNISKGNRFANRNGSSHNNEDGRKLIPNGRGLYTVCYRSEKAVSNDKEDIVEWFSEAGEVGEVNITPNWIFVRFKTKQGALSSLEKLSYLDVRIADEGKNKNKEHRNSLVEETEEENDSLLANKPQMRDIPPKRQDNQQEKQGAHKKLIRKGVPGGRQHEVFVGNITNTLKEEEFDEMIAEFNPRESRLVRKDVKLYAFVNFDTSEDAQRMIEAMDGQDIKGRRVEVRISKPDSLPSHNKPPANPPSSHPSGAGGGATSGRNMKGDINHHSKKTTYQEKPGILGPIPSDGLGREDASSSELNNSFESSSSFGCGRGLNLSERMRDISISIDSRGKKMVTSTPVGRSPQKPQQQLKSIRHMAEAADDMPELETTMPELEASMPDLENSVVVEDGKDDEPVSIFVANFHPSTTARELYILFLRYDVVSVNIVPAIKCPKAYVFLRNLDKAEAAIREMNQFNYLGRPLLLDIPRSTPQMREKLMARNCFAGGRPVSMTRSQVLDGLSDSLDYSSEDVSSESEQSIYEVLELYSHILVKMKVKRNALKQGSHIKVLVTAAEEETFFWGQVVSEMENLKALKRLILDLQDTDNHLARTKGLGRCAAVYEGEWHRAWVLKTSLRQNEKMKVFFVDYGNIERVQPYETCVVPPKFWELPPMAQPFTITGAGFPDLGALESSVVDCQVTKTAPVANAMLTEVDIVQT